ncbi:MAG: ABC transporter permease, partial [Chloroflexota bacterium]
VYNKDAYEDIMFIDLESFETRLAPQIEGEINLAAWYFVMDGSEIGPNQIDRTIVALRNVERRLQTALPEVQTLLDPTDALTLYRRDVGRLNQVLFAFNLPTIGLVLTFIGLIGRLWTDRLRSELAVMRSRGSSVTQLMGTVLVEALIIGAISYGLGILVSLLFSSWMGRARSFLDFSSESGVRVQLSNTTLLIGLAAAGIALLAQLLPTLPAAQQTIVSYKLIQARHTRPPWWQRAYLDFILLAMSLYGIYLVQQDGELISLAASAESDPFQNPLLLLLPALLIYAVTLLILRLLPWTMHQISRLLQLSDSVALLQAARYLARSSRSYATPFILLVLTVSFAIYTASLARTLDFHLYDQLFYQSGADINLFTAPRAENNFLGTTVSSDPEAFLDLPMSEYESLTGVNHATRVGQYPVEVRVGTDSISGEFYGLDRTTFGNVGYWRWDFSRYRLGSLLNGLGAREEGLIISRSLMRQTGLRVGETIQLTVSLSDQEVTFPAVVTGTFEQVPTWYPNEGGVLVVGNLDYLYDIAGNTYPSRVWLDTGPILDETDLRLGLNRLGLFTTTWIEPHSAIQARLERPERQGLFGLLSVGFVAATALTILGLCLYALFSYRQRVVELGILRAVGLPAGRMVRLIAWELALLLLIGLLLGSCLGITVSQLFIPSLQVGVTSIQQFPPMVVELSLGAIFQVYLFFGLLFILAFSVLALVTMRMRLFVAIKLGETI